MIANNIIPITVMTNGIKDIFNFKPNLASSVWLALFAGSYPVEVHTRTKIRLWKKYEKAEKTLSTPIKEASSRLAFFAAALSMASACTIRKVIPHSAL